MPRLRKYLLTTAGLLLSLSTAALWVQSHAAPRTFNLNSPTSYQVGSAAGVASAVAYGPLRPAPMFGGGISGGRTTLIADLPAVATLIQIDHHPNATTARTGYLLTVPYTTLLPLTLALTALAHLVDRRRRTATGRGFDPTPLPTTPTPTPAPPTRTPQPFPQIPQ